MGIYKRVNKTCGTPTDLYANVKEDGNKAVVHSPFGTKVYKKVESDSLDNDLLLRIQSNPNLSVRDLMPYIDALGNYIFLTNKPKINGVTLEGDKSTEDLKIYAKVGAEQVYFKDGKTLQEKLDDGSLGNKDYNKLDNKPSINGVILNGSLTTASLGILDDTNVSSNTTWSSERIAQEIKQTPVVTTLDGTDECPIIASELMLGTHVISGKVQSSRDNVTTIRVPRKQYIINRDVEGTTVLWELNPYTASQYYIVFQHSGLVEPITKTVDVISQEDLAKAEFDCGNF